MKKIKLEIYIVVIKLKLNKKFKWKNTWKYNANNNLWNKIKNKSHRTWVIEKIKMLRKYIVGLI